MKKPKISEMSNYEYPKGRIDKFEIEDKINLHIPVILLFKELGFDNDVIEELDRDYISNEGYFSFYCKNIKAHIFIDEKKVSLIFDSNEKREDLIKVIEKYFTIF